MTFTSDDSISIFMCNALLWSIQFLYRIHSFTYAWIWMLKPKTQMVQSGQQAMPFDTAMIDWFLCEYWHLTLKVESKYHSVLVTAHRTTFHQPISNSIKWLTPAQHKLTAHTKFIIFIFQSFSFCSSNIKTICFAWLGLEPPLSMTLRRRKASTFYFLQSLYFYLPISFYDTIELSSLLLSNSVLYNTMIPFKSVFCALSFHRKNTTYV